MAATQTRSTGKTRNVKGIRAKSSAVSTSAPLKINAVARKFGLEFVNGKYMWNDVAVKSADISGLISFLNDLQGELPTRTRAAH